MPNTDSIALRLSLTLLVLLTYLSHCRGCPVTSITERLMKSILECSVLI